MAEKDCARCGAKLAAGAGWCSLCYAPVETYARATREWSDTLSDEREDELDAAESGSLDGQRQRPVGRHRAPSGGLAVFDAPVQTVLPTAAVEVATETTGDKPALEGSWPCLGCGTPNLMEWSVCAACGLAFLAQAKTPPSLQVPGLGDVFQRSRAQQIAFIAAVGLVMLGAVIGLMALLGLVL